MKESRLNQVIALVLLVAVMAIGWQVRDWGADTDLELYQEQIEQFQGEISTVSEFSDSLVDENKILLDSLKMVEKAAAKIQIEVEVLVEINRGIIQQVDSLQREFAAIDPTLIPPPVLEYIDALEMQVDTLQTTVETQSQLLSVKDVDIRLLQGLHVNEKARADSLQITLDGFPGDVPDNEKLFGFIPLPSRTVSFISGAATVAVGIIAITR